MQILTSPMPMVLRLPVICKQGGGIGETVGYFPFKQSVFNLYRLFYYELRNFAAFFKTDKIIYYAGKG